MDCNKTLKKFINELNIDTANIKTLPLVHTTNVSRFFSIVEKMNIVPQTCPNLQNDYVYFFYGRGAYIPKDEEKQPVPYHYLPINIIFDYNAVSQVKAYAFDSGGYINKFYDKYIDKKFSIEFFELEPIEESYQKYIKYFYDKNENYYSDNVKKELNLYKYNVVNQYYTLITNGEIDKRSRTIEVISNKKVEINDSCMVIVLPDACLTHNPELIKVLKDKNIKIVFYYLYGNLALQTACDRLQYVSTNIILHNILKIEREEFKYV